MTDVDNIKDLAKNIAESAIYLGFAGLGFFVAKGIVVAVASLL